MLHRAVMPRRVLMTCDAIGGIWRYSVDLARALNRHEISTILVGTGPAPSAQARAEADGTPVVWLDRAPTWLAASAGEIEALAGELARLQRLCGADLVHLNQPAEAAFLEARVPVAVAAHSCLTTWWRRVRGGTPPAEWGWRTALETIGLHRADAVLAPSASHAADLESAYRLDAVTVVPNACDGAGGGPERAPFVLAAARWWDAGKNLATLDAAAASCRWPIEVYGSLDGPDGSHVTPRHARPRGARPAAELRDRMRRAAVFVSPSLYEPFGLAALEAARSGAALVLADIPTYREIWQGAALFFDPRAPGDLAAGLDALAGDRERRDRLAAAAGRVAAAFSPDRQVAELLRAYDLAVARAAGLRKTG
jgi:glycosyltransferase involved in cell wall biosynthesis